MSTTPAPAAPSAATPPHKESIKETIISVIIAFAMAFVFRSFVAEAFIIPTGSMAPTLNGAHMRFTSPYTGEDWAVAPWFYIDNNTQNPYPSQADEAARNNIGRAIPVHDPITGLEIADPVGKARAGDRIFVLKYLYGIQRPEPYDVVVFKNPTNPDENYIKRLIALPGEQVALVDGDVFVRPAPEAVGGAGAGANPWDASDWTIRRKPDDAQEAVWMTVFDSALMTAAAVEQGAVSPWVATGATAESAFSRYSTTGAPAVISWDRLKPFVRPSALYRGSPDQTREINDRYAYNESPSRQANMPRFPVGDLRLRAAVTVKQGVSDASGLTLTGTIEARRHAFSATIAGGKAVLTMRPLDGAGEPRTLGEGAVPAFTPGKPVRVELWHSDQRVQLWVGGERVAQGEYDWLPMERLRHALTPEAFDQVTGKAPTRSFNILADAAAYVSSGARWETSGVPVELRAVAVDRDLFYRPSYYEHQTMNVPARLVNTPAAATHPSSTLTLAKDQYFVCGDNSPQSLDGRLWGNPDPWVAESFDPSPSVVSRRLMMGKAFFVYFPSPVGGNPIGVPDFGRLRAIR